MGKAATAVGATEHVKEALGALGDCRASAALRLWIVSTGGELRTEILADLFDRLNVWEGLLFRREARLLASKFVDEFGVAAAARAVHRLDDAFTRTTYLHDVAELTSDVVVKRSLLFEALEAAKTVGADRDYALKWAIGGFLSAGMLAEASAAVATLEDPAIRLDYLLELQGAFKRAGLGDAAAAAGSQRDQQQEANPERRPQSELLAEAYRLVQADIDGNAKRDGALDPNPGAAATDPKAAAAEIRETYPTRVCLAAWNLPPALLESVLSFQLARVQSYARNDLKVEFLTDLAVAFHTHGVESGARERLEDALGMEAWLRVEVASPPSITARDPSEMSLDEFARFLFDRSVAKTPEEERFMGRDADRDPGVSDKGALVRLGTELFRRFGEIAGAYAVERVEQAMWFLNGYPFFLMGALAAGDVPDSLAVECVAAAYHVFADYVAVNASADGASSFYMWWDEDWTGASTELAAAAISTLERILLVPNKACRQAALHGLNHLHPHPNARSVIEAYLAVERSSLTQVRSHSRSRAAMGA